MRPQRPGALIEHSVFFATVDIQWDDWETDKISSGLFGLHAALCHCAFTIAGLNVGLCKKKLNSNNSAVR